VTGESASAATAAASTAAFTRKTRVASEIPPSGLDRPGEAGVVALKAALIEAWLVVIPSITCE
jgi:hypothetical protein